MNFKEFLRGVAALVFTPFWLVFAALVDIWSEINFDPYCKKCGARLVKTGYPKDGVQYYKCPRGCKP